MTAIRWARANLFSGWLSSIVTLVMLYLAARGLWAVIDWGVINAVWSAPDGRACLAANQGDGACWAFIGVWDRFILFGRYPRDEHWRPLLAVLIVVALMAASCDRRLWGKKLGLLWFGGAVAFYILMAGGILGLRPVGTDVWNGLPLTLMLSIMSLVLAFPLAILLALGRRSRLPALRAVSIGYIELMRGVPIITVLFMASVMLPLFLPGSMNIDKLARAISGLTLFYAAYLAEVVRGGLQAIPRGQYEAAEALGLSYSRRMILVILPQALRIAVPPLVNTFISAFKDTTLVTIIGLFDLISTAGNAITDPNWRGFYLEAYAFIGAIYFAFCYFMSRYSRRLEQTRAGAGHGR